MDFVNLHCIDLLSSYVIWAAMRENLSSGLATNIGTDQPVHAHSRIRVFVIAYRKVSYLNLQ